MIGTAFPAARLLLVEQPGAWGRRGLRDSRFPSRQADALERRANAAGLRVQAIRRPGRDANAGAEWAWAVVDTRPGVQSVRWGTWRDPDELLELPLDGTAGEVRPHPVYLVCSHAKHDVCCALRGRPVAQALHELRPGQVWETTHLGDDRFGANVLALPLGELYGRVLPFAVADLVAATERGELLTPLLRGRIGYPPPAQAALARAAVEFGQARTEAVQVLETIAGPDRTWSVRLRTPAGEVRAAVHAERVAAVGLTCANPGPSGFFAYVVDGLRPA